MSVPSDETLQRSLELLAPVDPTISSRLEATRNSPNTIEWSSARTTTALGPSAKRAVDSRETVAELAKLVDGSLALESFVDQTLSLISRIYGARTVVLWMADPTSAHAVFRICHRSPELPLSSAKPSDRPEPPVAAVRAEVKAISLRATRPVPAANTRFSTSPVPPVPSVHPVSPVSPVSPDSTCRPVLSAAVSPVPDVVNNQADEIPSGENSSEEKPVEMDNPQPQFSDSGQADAEHDLISQAWNGDQAMFHYSTDQKSHSESIAAAQFPRLFAPIRHFDRTIALLDIKLAPFSTLPPSAETRGRLIASASLIAARIHSGLRRRMPLPQALPSAAKIRLERASQSVDAIREQVRLRIEQEVSQLAGWSFSSFTENQEIAKEIHRLLDANSLRVQCNECGNAAILRCIKAGNAKRGVFVFDHYLDHGRTFHGGTSSIPDLRVIPRPPRRNNATDS